MMKHLLLEQPDCSPFPCRLITVTLSSVSVRVQPSPTLTPHLFATLVAGGSSALSDDGGLQSLDVSDSGIEGTDDSDEGLGVLDYSDGVFIVGLASAGVGKFGKFVADLQIAINDYE
jgi:hypothetical protein